LQLTVIVVVVLVTALSLVHTRRRTATIVVSEIGDYNSRQCGQGFR